MIGFVYAVQAGEFGRIKIGFTSRSPRERLRSIATACPYPLRLLALVEGDEFTEQNIHRALDEDRLHLEWFAPSARVLAVLWEMGIAQLPESERITETTTAAEQPRKGGRKPKSKRGGARPGSGRPRVHANGAARVAAHRARQKAA